MKNWTDYLICLNQCPDSGSLLPSKRSSFWMTLAVLCFLHFDVSTKVYAQVKSVSNFSDLSISTSGSSNLFYHEFHQIHDSSSVRDTVPSPRSVMYKSLILPGWGQITNRQAWKVPIIYGLLTGVTAYTIYSNDRYQGYKAAYYNSIEGNTDQRFGPTPDYIPVGQPSELYRSNRNTFRNRRDLSIIGIFLVYGLNIADAYIFAHLRDFDVSDDLSASLNPTIQNTDGQQTASLTLKISF